jgi:Flp pilus assembly protein TadB
MLMNPDAHGGPGPGSSSKTGLASLGIAALAVLCCAAVPLLAAVAGGLALGALVGVAAGVVAVLVLVALIVAWTRRRRTSAPAQIPTKAGGSM